MESSQADIHAYRGIPVGFAGYRDNVSESQIFI